MTDFEIYRSGKNVTVRCTRCGNRIAGRKGILLSELAEIAMIHEKQACAEAER